MKGVFMVVNAQIIKKNGKKEFAILPYDEFQKIQEELASYEDLRCLREAKMAEKEAPTIGIAELEKRIKGRTSQSSRPRKLGG
jgi:PHD/YefM family antitoxin component YafN of YafNO toxin-antitoxin module